MRFPALLFILLASPLASSQAIPAPFADSQADGWLGVVLNDDDGLVAERVVPGSPAEAGGLQDGDIIVSVGGIAVQSSGTMIALIRELGAGETASIVVRRDDSQLTLDVLLAERPPQSELSGLLVGAAFPWHEATDVRTGDRVVPPAERDTWTVVEFWATWCGPCHVAAPRVAALADSWRGRVGFVSVANDEEATLRSFLAQTPHDWDQIADPEDFRGSEVLLIARPTWFLVAPGGEIHATFVGLGGVEVLGEALEALEFEK